MSGPSAKQVEGAVELLAAVGPDSYDWAIVRIRELLDGGERAAAVLSLCSGRGLEVLVRREDGTIERAPRPARAG